MAKSHLKNKYRSNGAEANLNSWIKSEEEWSYLFDALDMFTKSKDEEINETHFQNVLKKRFLNKLKYNNEDRNDYNDQDNNNDNDNQNQIDQQFINQMIQIDKIEKDKIQETKIKTEFNTSSKTGLSLTLSSLSSNINTDNTNNNNNTDHYNFSKLLLIAKEFSSDIRLDYFSWLDFNWCLKYTQWKCQNLGNRFDVCLIDETQDLFPVVKSILFNQKWAIIAVGDSLQQINRFMDCENVLQELNAKATEQHTFSQTFRFSNNVASFVTNVFHHFEPLPKPLTSLSEMDTLVESSSSTLILPNLGNCKSYTILGRGKMSLVFKSIALAEQGIEFMVCPSVYETLSVLLRWANLSNNQLQSKLISARKDQNQDLLRILNYLEKQEQYQYSSSSLSSSSSSSSSLNNENHSPSSRICIQFANKLRKIVRVLRKHAVVSLMTGHASKGIDVEAGELLADFDYSFSQLVTVYHHIRNKLPNIEWKVTDQDELYLLYVALTRFRRCMRLPPLLYNFYTTKIIPSLNLIELPISDER